MKHIKTYKIFESIKLPDGVSAETIEEICYEITDDGKFTYRLGYNNGSYFILISLINIHDYNGFKLSEVMDCVLRLRDYLGSHYLTCNVVYIGASGRSGRSIIDLTIDESLIKEYYKNSISNLAIYID